MLDIVPSSNLVQYQGKLMMQPWENGKIPNLNQTWENGKRFNFGPDFGLFGPNLPLPPKFFCGFYLYWYLDIVRSYHPMQFQGKIMNQTWENGKKPNFGPDFGPFSPKFGSQKNFLWVLPLVDVIHCCKLSLCAISRKTNNQTWENDKKI